jgi:hypothetical protein
MLELFRSIQGTKGLELYSDQNQRIVELTKLISDLLQSIKALTRSELEESLGDLMIYLSSTLNLNRSEILAIFRSTSS